MFLRHFVAIFVVVALLLPSVAPASLAFEAEPQDQVPLLEQPNDTLANNHVEAEPDSVVVKEKPKDPFCKYVLPLAAVGFIILWSTVIWWRI